MKRPTLALLLFPSLLLAGCATGERLAPRTPAVRVVQSPRANPIPTDSLSAQVMRLAWERAGQLALESAVPAAGGFSERLSLPRDEPQAVAYELSLVAGQEVTIEVLQAAGASDFALQVFQRGPAGAFALLQAHDAPAAPAVFRAAEAGSYVVRVQPEAGGGGEYVVRVRGESSLAFPIPGYDVGAIRSPYGSARDGGTREHEGVDIFAPRGTPVTAAARAVVTRVESTRAGGKVIWAEDPELALTYYYAHLDAQLVKRGARLSPGDTIGRVGNTGNARRASPHLHFAIYRPRLEPVDPTPLLAGASLVMSADTRSTGLLGSWAHTTGSGVRLRSTPSTGAPVLAALDRGTPVRVVGVLRDWHRVRLIDGRSGFIAGGLLERAALATN